MRLLWTHIKTTSLVLENQMVGDISRLTKSTTSWILRVDSTFVWTQESVTGASEFLQAKTRTKAKRDLLQNQKDLKYELKIQARATFHERHLSLFMTSAWRGMPENNQKERAVRNQYVSSLLTAPFFVILLVPTSETHCKIQQGEVGFTWTSAQANLRCCVTL